MPVDLLAVASEKIATTFNSSGATRTVVLDIPKAFVRVWHDDLLHKFKCYGISGQVFDLISSFLSNRCLRVILDGKSSQEYTVNAEVPQSSILGATFFSLFIVIYADDNTLSPLSPKCKQVTDLWQQLELELVNEYDLEETVDWGRKWLADFNAGNTQFVPFDWSNNSDNIDVKINWSVLEKKPPFKMLGLSFFPKLD